VAVVPEITRPGGSMSRRGNCHDNAVAESFFQLLKRERIKKKIYGTREEAGSDIFDYIEMFYNSKRRHGSSEREMHRLNMKTYIINGSCLDYPWRFKLLSPMQTKSLHDAHVARPTRIQVRWYQDAHILR
jgi:hypothetical protein